MSDSACLTVFPKFGARINASPTEKVRDLVHGLIAAFKSRSIDARMALSLAEESYETLAPTTAGTSDIARFISEQTAQGKEQLLRSISLGGARKTIQAELQNLVEQCARPNWDGYGAAPVKETVVRNASRFADVVLIGLMFPSVAPEPDGAIAFEWYAGPRKTLSVSIDEEGTLHYAALIGPSRSYGTEAFVGILPRQILDLIYRVSAA
jgi:hypothetical protein